MKNKTITISQELEDRLGEAVDLINQNQITGNINQSKLIRIAVAEYLEKLAKIKQVNEEHANAFKTAEQLLKENGY